MALDSPKWIHRFIYQSLFIFSELGFWIVASRNFFAIPEIEYRKDETPPSAKKKTKSFSSTPQSDNQFIDEAVEFKVEKVRKVREEVGKIGEVTFRHKFSLSFIQSFEEGFRYLFCHLTPAKLPLSLFHSIRL